MRALNWLREFGRRLRFLLRHDGAAAELEEEMRLHVELREARLRERGAAPLEAYYAARRRFGNRTNLQQRSRDMWGLEWLYDALADIRFAARRLRRRPGFALSTILVAALGIGATTAVFSAIDAAFIRPLPFARPDELVTLNNLFVPLDMQNETAVRSGSSGPQAPRAATTTLTYDDAAAMHDVFSDIGAYAAGGLNLANATNPRRVRVGVVSANFFSVLGAIPSSGRTFDVAEGKPHGPHSVVLSNALWRDAFGGAAVTGQSIDLSGTRYTIVGVMKPGFSFPYESDLWIPLTIPATSETFAPFRGFLMANFVARLAPGVTPAAANARLLDRWRQIVGPPAPEHSRLDESIKTMQATGALAPLQRVLVGYRRKALVILMGAAALLLLIACANVANLLLSDAAARRREIALRVTLGATPWRITRQLLSESALIAVAGAVLGVALAPAMLRVLRALTPSGLAGVAPTELDARVLLFAIVLAIVTAMVFGLWPALGTAKTDAGETIKSGGLGATAGVGRARQAIVVAELAMTVMLVVGSGLMLRSLERVLSQGLGLNPEHVATLELSFSYGKSRVGMRTVDAIVARLAADPGIRAVGAVNDLPLRGGGGMSLNPSIDGQPEAASVDEVRFARYLMASPGYFAAMDIPLLRGRLYTATTDSLAPREAIINQTMAKQFWPNDDALGRTFHLMGPAPITVVGIVADVREASLEGDVGPQMYLPIEREGPWSVALVARGTVPSETMLARLRDAVRAVDPSQAVYNVRTMDEVLSTSIAPRRTNTLLIAIFGAIALALAAFGVYAVVSYSVTRRTREFGIRSALGASGLDIASLVGREMLWVVSIGLVLGLGGAWALSKVLASLLYGVDAHDITTFAAAPIALLLPTAIATLIPARRATRVDPIEVMRAE